MFPEFFGLLKLSSLILKTYFEVETLPWLKLALFVLLRSSLGLVFYDIFFVFVTLLFFTDILLLLRTLVLDCSVFNLLKLPTLLKLFKIFFKGLCE